MFHKPENFITITDEVSSQAAALGVVAPEVYSTFVEYLEALMTPYTSASGQLLGDYYEKMMPIAAQLTTASAVLAAAYSPDDTAE